MLSYLKLVHNPRNKVEIESGRESTSLYILGYDFSLTLYLGCLAKLEINSSNL
jgi:hypothetical protein